MFNIQSFSKLTSNFRLFVHKITLPAFAFELLWNLTRQEFVNFCNSAVSRSVSYMLLQLKHSAWQQYNNVAWKCCTSIKVFMYLRTNNAKPAEFSYFPSDRNYCISLPCLNGGTCTNGATSFSCSCPYGYSGSYCQDESKLNIIFLLLHKICGKVPFCFALSEWFDALHDWFTHYIEWCLQTCKHTSW